MDCLDYKFAEQAVKKKSAAETMRDRYLDLYTLVTEKGRINRFEAYATLGFNTPGVYERLHTNFVVKYAPRIIYEKKTKDYIDTTVIQKEQETLI